MLAISFSNLPFQTHAITLLCRYSNDEERVLFYPYTHLAIPRPTTPHGLTHTFTISIRTLNINSTCSMLYGIYILDTTMVGNGIATLQIKRTRQTRKNWLMFHWIIRNNKYLCSENWLQCINFPNNHFSSPKRDFGCKFTSRLLSTGLIYHDRRQLWLCRPALCSVCFCSVWMII